MASKEMPKPGPRHKKPRPGIELNNYADWKKKWNRRKIFSCWRWSLLTVQQHLCSKLKYTTRISPIANLQQFRRSMETWKGKHANQDFGEWKLRSHENTQIKMTKSTESEKSVARNHHHLQLYIALIHNGQVLPVEKSTTKYWKNATSNFCWHCSATALFLAANSSFLSRRDLPEHLLVFKTVILIL